MQIFCLKLDYPQRIPIITYEGDICDRTILNRAIANCSVVFHLAAQPYRFLIDKNIENNDDDYWHDNLTGIIIYFL